MFMGWQALGMESKWQINVLHFLITLWMGDILPMCTCTVASPPALRCPSSLGQKDGYGGSFWTLKHLFKLFRRELSIWRLCRMPAGFQERILEAEGPQRHLGELSGALHRIDSSLQAQQSLPPPQLYS